MHARQYLHVVVPRAHRSKTVELPAGIELHLVARRVDSRALHPHATEYGPFAQHDLPHAVERPQRLVHRIIAAAGIHERLGEVFAEQPGCRIEQAPDRGGTRGRAKSVADSVEGDV